MKEDWIECKLGEICTIDMGQSPPSSTYNTDGKGLPFFQGKAEFTKLHPIVKKWCTKPKKIAEKGDILISVRAPVGSTNIANQKCAIGRGLASIRYDYDNKFIWFFLKLAKSELDNKGTGSTFKAISGTILKTQNVIFPPLAEQKAIVKKIEALFSDLDQGIADLKKAQEQLKIYRQAVLKKAFEGENILKAKKDKLKNITSKIGSGSTPKGGQANYKTSGIPLIRSLNIHFDYIKYEGLAFIDEKQAEKLKNVIVNEGDVLLNITGASIGRVNIAPKEFDNGRVNQHVSIIRPIESAFITKFLKLFLQSSEIQNWIANINVGATRQGLTKSALENLEIPIPPIEEQHQIIKEIESRLSVCDAVEQNISESLEKAKALRQSILKKAFEGKLLSEEEIAQCKAQPDYEPASVLLERIKKEKKK